MDLNYWLFRNKIKKSKMAEDMGMHVQTIFLVISGRSTPSLFTALAIEKYTKGEVTLFDILSSKDKEKYKKIVEHN